MVFILLFLLIFPLSVSSREIPEGACLITDTLEVSRDVTPDVYSFSVRVSAKGKSEGEVLRALSVADSYLKGLELPYSGGNFNVHPLVEWDSKGKKYVFVGFSGSAFYTFSLRSVSQQSEILRALNRSKREVPIVYSITNTRWVVSEDRRKRVTERLKLELLRRARREAQVFGREVGKSCSIRVLRFKSYYRVFPVRFELTKSAPSPKRSFRKLRVEGEVEFLCR